MKRSVGAPMNAPMNVKDLKRLGGGREADRLAALAAAALAATAEVPFGRTTTYGTLAERIGRPRASRAVGNALGSNPIPIVVPCHRVLRAGGDVGGYAGGPSRKRRLLTLEGSLPPTLA